MCSPRDRNIIDFVNGLGAIAVIIYHEQTIDTLGNGTADVAFDDLDSRRAVLVESDRAVFSRIMQIVTSALRDSTHALSSRVSCEVSGRNLGYQAGPASQTPQTSYAK